MGLGWTRGLWGYVRLQAASAQGIQTLNDQHEEVKLCKALTEFLVLPIQVQMTTAVCNPVDSVPIR